MVKYFWLLGFALSTAAYVYLYTEHRQPGLDVWIWMAVLNVLMGLTTFLRDLREDSAT